MSRTKFVRRRRYDQWPRETEGWSVQFEGGGYFADRANPNFERERRRQSWRRPL